MNSRHYLIKGTFLLTAAGLITRIAGFYYKIFLSRTIGAEEIGLFQLTLPVIMLCISLSSGGIQSAVSRFTAEYYAENRRSSAHMILACSLFLSVTLSGLCSLILWTKAPWIAGRLLLEPRCTQLLQILALSLPFCTVHGCIGGYFAGCKRVTLSASAQLIEQMIRICSVFFFYALSLKKGWKMNASVMAFGQLSGELAAFVFCGSALLFCAADLRKPNLHAHSEGKILRNPPLLSPASATWKLLAMALPLSLTRVFLSVLQGIEAALFPQQLQLFGLNSSGALSVYGTLTGMALPMILFPTAITSSLSTVMLPAVSEAHALDQEEQINVLIQNGFQGSLYLGYFFLAAFLLFGRDLGNVFFHSALAGEFIQKMALVCPFLYINTTLGSTLHGLGKTAMVSFTNVTGFFVRLAFVTFFVPKAGVNGYFAGIFLAQAGITFCALYTLHRTTGFTPELSKSILWPGLICIISSIPQFFLRLYGPSQLTGTIGGQLAGCIIYTVIFLTLSLRFLLPTQYIGLLKRHLLHKMH